MDYIDNIIGLQHIGIPVKDVMATANFYENIGFVKKGEYINGADKVCFLELKSIMVELYEESTAYAASGAINHFAINVKDINEAYKSIRKKNVKVVEPIKKLLFWDNGIRFFIIEGINGERIEFSQYL